MKMTGAVLQKRVASVAACRYQVNGLVLNAQPVVTGGRLLLVVFLQSDEVVHMQRRCP